MLGKRPEKVSPGLIHSWWLSLSFESEKDGGRKALLIQMWKQMKDSFSLEREIPGVGDTK